LVRQAVPVPVVFLNYYRPGLLFADFGDAKTLVRWTLIILDYYHPYPGWRCWVYWPVTSPRFLLFGRRGGVTHARFSYFPVTCKYTSTFSLQRYYFLKTLPLTSSGILKISNNDTVCTYYSCMYSTYTAVHTTGRYGYIVRVNLVGTAVCWIVPGRGTSRYGVSGYVVGTAVYTAVADRPGVHTP
jgi:hypothetical protein